MKVTAKRERIAAAEKRYVCIVFCHWRKKWKTGTHFVTAHQKDGYFVGYNTIRNPTGPDIPKSPSGQYKPGGGFLAS